MCCGDDASPAQTPNEEGVPISAGDLERVRVLRSAAVEALLEVNAILSKYVDVDADSVDSVTITLRGGGPEFDGVPPVMLCSQFNSGGVCAYVECAPPGATYPCPVVTLPPPT